MVRGENDLTLFQAGVAAVHIFIQCTKEFNSLHIFSISHYTDVLNMKLLSIYTTGLQNMQLLLESFAQNSDYWGVSLVLQSHVCYYKYLCIQQITIQIEGNNLILWIDNLFSLKLQSLQDFFSNGHSSQTSGEGTKLELSNFKVFLIWQWKWLLMHWHMRG